MDVERNLDHLVLSHWSEPLPRRKNPGGGAFRREDRGTHGKEIALQVDAVVASLDTRVRDAPAGINPKLIFKLRLNPKGRLSDDQLRQLGLHVLAKEPNNVTVVFPDDATLQDLRRRVREYAGIDVDGHAYDYLAAIDAIAAIAPEEKIGPRLRRNPLGPDEVVALDVELWHTGNVDECRGFVAQLREFLVSTRKAMTDPASSRMGVTDSYVGRGICLVRAKLSATVLNDLLGSDAIDFIKQIDRRPRPSFELLDITHLALPDITIDPGEMRSRVGVLIVDSGVMQAHPLLAPAIGDAQVFSDGSSGRIRGGPEDGDEHSGGHGTAVGGIAVYGDIQACVASRSFCPSAQLFSARVTDEDNQYDEEQLLEHQLAEAVEYFVRNYPSIRVINISLGDDALVYGDGLPQFRFAAAIDELAYQYRDHHLVFVVSAGNYWPTHLDGDAIKASYPDYLLDTVEARLIDPATAAIPLTVGGLSHGPARDLRGFHDTGTEQLVAGERGWPSPFTRTGWGVGEAVKPDVVDFAGDWRYERGRVNPFPAADAGLPTTAKDFAPPEGRLFRTVSGTSFSAPRVANLAARLFREFPEASANLIRALIATSAEVPSERPARLQCLNPWENDILRVYGFGQPDFARAAWSAQNDVLLIVDDQLAVDNFVLFEIPALPEEFLTTRGLRALRIALAYDPPTRHSRSDSYLGVTLSFRLYRNVEPSKVSDALRILSPEERETIGDDSIPNLTGLEKYLVDMLPKPSRLRKGTLQRAIHRIASRAWKYDGSPLVLAVSCQRQWSPPEITHQGYAIVVSIAHESPLVDLYTAIRQQSRVYQRTRIRL